MLKKSRSDNKTFALPRTPSSAIRPKSGPKFQFTKFHSLFYSYYKPAYFFEVMSLTIQ